MSQALVGGSRDTGAPLRRHASERWLGGVAGGIARYFNIDPTITRAGLVALMFMGGTGVPIYIGALLLMPADGEQTSIAERMLKNKHGEWSKPAVIVVALLALTIFGAPSDGPIGALFPLLLIGGGLYLLANRAGGRQQVAGPTQTWQPAGQPVASATMTPDPATPPPPPTAPMPPPVDVGPAAMSNVTSAPPPPSMTPSPMDPADDDPILVAARELDAELYDPTPTWQPYTYEPEPVPFVPKKRRNPLVGIALSTLVLGGGVAVLLAAAGLASASAATLGALGLIIVGGALVLSRPLGGARVLIPVGAVLFLMATVSGGGDFGDVDGFGGDFSVAPTLLDAPDGRTDYNFGGGAALIDLSSAEVVGTQTVVARMGGGELTILVPDDVKIIANAGAAGGDVNLFGRSSSGFAPSDQVTLNNDATGGTLIIDAQILGGELTLREVPRAVEASEFPADRQSTEIPDAPDAPEPPTAPILEETGS